MPSVSWLGETLRSRVVGLALSACLLSLLGCGAPEVAIPTLPPSACGGAGSELLRLHGDPNATEPVWLVGVESGDRYSARWPSGYSAVFTPRVEIRNRLRQTIAREGDMLEIDGVAFQGEAVICSIVAVNRQSPPPEPIPTAVPVPTRRPTDVPPPLGIGSIDLEVCGYNEDGILTEEIPFFIVRFEALEGQPHKSFSVRDAGCERRTYRVAAGRYNVIARAPGLSSYAEGIPVEIRPNENSGLITLEMLRQPSPSLTP